MNSGNPIVQSYRGHSCNTFYVKAGFSSDDRYVISGSTDSKAYIWEA
jgi:hypothetical protein